MDIAVQKTADPANGTQVQAGDAITYTLTATLTGSAIAEDLVLTDTLGDGLTFGAVTEPGSFVATGSDQDRVFTLPAGTPAGTYTVRYTATVNDQAAATIQNNVAASGGGGNGTPQCTDCRTEHPLLLDIVAQKRANPASGTQLQAGDTVTYTLTATVTGSATSADLVLTDTLGEGLTFGSITGAGSFTAGGTGQERTFTLPAGTPAGTYEVSYTSAVNERAAGGVENSVTAAGGGDPDPECTDCSTEHPVLLEIAAEKRADPADGTQIGAGETVTYTLSVTVTGSATTADLVLTDTLGDGLIFQAVTDAGTFTAGGSGQTRTFTLPAGTPAGTYTVSYTAGVDEKAIGTLSNSIIAAGGGDPDPACTTCSTSHEVLPPDVSIAKRLIDESGPTDNVAEIGETLTYEITLTNEGGFTDSYAVQDVLSEDLVFESADLGGVHSGGTPGGGTVDWSGLQVPARAGGAPGVLVLTVSARVADTLNPDQPLRNIAREPGGRSRTALPKLARLSSRKRPPSRRRKRALIRTWMATARRAWETGSPIRSASGIPATSR